MKGKSILCAVVALLLLAPAAHAGPSDPEVFTPTPPPVAPPPTGYLNGPCGVAVDSSGRLYVSDHYHHAVDVFNGTFFVTQLANEDPLGGPCGLALDSTNQLYVNNYHRNIVKFGASPSFGVGTVFPLPETDTAQHLPVGLDVDPDNGRVYVNHRTYISVYELDGNPVLDGGEPLRIGVGSLGDAYGVAVSRYSGTLGRVYVPDAASNTVKVYDPLVSKTTPVSEIKDPFGSPFVSLRDSAIAVDRVRGDVYFSVDLQPELSERPQASIYVYSATNVYKGRLKYNVIDARPPGLTVNNSNVGQGGVSVTSGNTDKASIYGYGPNAATFATPLPPIDSGLAAPGTSGLKAEGPNAARRPSASASVVTQKDNLRLSVEGKLSPKKLPREGSAPISVSVGWDIATVDGSPPPDLEKLGIEINKQGRFETAGLPTCPYSRIQPATTKRALSNCRSALVGRGSFSANITLKGQEGESYTATGQLLVFNGTEKGKPVLFGQIYSASPFATSFVIVFKVAKIRKGDYGTALTAILPASLRTWGDLTGIQMTLSRRYSYEGKKRSYISAGCPAPKGFGAASFKLARTSFAFASGKELTSTITGDCRARG